MDGNRKGSRVRLKSVPKRKARTIHILKRDTPLTDIR